MKTVSKTLAKPVTIDVPFEVLHYETRKGSMFVTIWGLVGDYEVMTHITILEAVQKGLIDRRKAMDDGLVSQFVFKEKSRKTMGPGKVRIELGEPEAEVATGD